MSKKGECYDNAVAESPHLTGHQILIVPIFFRINNLFRGLGQSPNLEFIPIPNLNPKGLNIKLGDIILIKLLFITTRRTITNPLISPLFLCMHLCFYHLNTTT
jgi:hypothetical protein